MPVTARPPIDTDQTGEITPATPAGAGEPCLVRPLASGFYGASYLGTLPYRAESVEVRRLTKDFDPALLDELTARTRLIGVLRSPAVRRLLVVELDAAPLSLVVESRGEFNLETWVASGQMSPRELLRLLVSVAECLAEAHHFGLSHGALSETTIGVKDGAPAIDFTGWESDAATLGRRAGSPESITADQRGLVALVNWALAQDGVADACRESSHRQAARLRQLGNRGAAPTEDLPEASEILNCLRSLVDPPTDAAAPSLVDSTTELPARAPGQDDCGTVDQLLSRGVGGDGTAEIGLAGTPRIAVPPYRALQPGERLGRFQIDRKLGEGGMGAVFRATDIGSGQVVALKVLSQSAVLRGNAVQRFAKEARLLASLNNPFITNLIEVSDENGLHYIALEFVDGVDAGRVLDESGPMPERVALSIAADVARALIDAHRREIVHRDIKPENILLVDHTGGDPLAEPPRAKLADFGIARHVDQSESLAVTQAGSLLGTPKYMSPEQCRGGGEITPQADIYSLGVTLFELLSGAPPFEADDPMTLVGKHCFEPAPSLRKLVPELSEPTTGLVAKCLAKRPEDRYPDAATLLRELDRMLRGEPSRATLRPVLPDHNSSRVVGATHAWSLDSSPQALWPYVSNTERLNRAIGLPPVEYRTEVDSNGAPRRFGTIRLAGIPMTWEEHPFEWVEGRRMSILREFTGGPFRWFMSTVELAATPDGGCDLRHTVKILSRNFVGRMIATVETGSKCRKSLESVYSRIDETLRRAGRNPLRDAFEPVPKLKTAQRERLLAGIDAMVADGAPTDICEGLQQFLLEAPEQEVAKVRPVALARRLGLDESQVIDTCLRAVKQGLLQMQWDLLCPTCRVAADTRSTLKEIEAHTHCEACDFDFRSNAADAVELVFRAHPDIRDTALGKYCVGGPWHAPHVAAQFRLEPAERLEADLALEAGDYVLRGPRLTRTYPLRVVTSGAASCGEFRLGPHDDGDERVTTLRTGGQVLSLENGFDCQQVVRVERTLPREDIVTAARASATPRFRELFPGEVFESGQLVSAEQVTMLVVSIPTIDDLYEQAGDAEAYAAVQRHLSDSSASIQQNGGEVVKVIGETIFASFHDAVRAVESAFALAAERPDSPFRLAVGVHRGNALVATANNRLDYFGSTARQALALPNATGPGVALTEPVLTAGGVAERLGSRDEYGTMRKINLPGKRATLVQHFEKV